MDDLVRTYLQEISRVPLLTQEQELVYGKQVQQMMYLVKAKETLAKKLRREPTGREWALYVHMSEAELNETLDRGQQVKRKMVKANLRLVVAIAKKYRQKRHLEFLDLIQEGTIGLIQGVEKFDPTRGYKFSTYAYGFIRQAIMRAIAEKSRTIRLPSHISEKLKKIKNSQLQLSHQLGRAPTTSELAAVLELTPKQVRDCLEWARLPLSLNLLLGDSQDTELGELLSDTGTTPEEYVMQSNRSMDLEPLMAELTPQQREVLALRFGLVNNQTLTLAQIGARLSISSERVGLIERKTLNQLRRYAY
jgi:RNA polymerase nonessential primary-like sigma factor